MLEDKRNRSAMTLNSKLFSNNFFRMQKHPFLNFDVKFKKKIFFSIDYSVQRATIILLHLIYDKEKR